jgi:hypothetical protein
MTQAAGVRPPDETVAIPEFEVEPASFHLIAILALLTGFESAVVATRKVVNRQLDYLQLRARVWHTSLDPVARAEGIEARRELADGVTAKRASGRDAVLRKMEEQLKLR